MFEGGADAVPGAAPRGGLLLQEPLEGLGVGGEHGGGAQLLGVRETAQQPVAGRRRQAGETGESGVNDIETAETT